LEIHCQDSGCRSSYYRVRDSGGIDRRYIGSHTGRSILGALAGGLIGGAVGGIAAAINGGSFLEGFADGALSGAISGAVTERHVPGLVLRSSSREKHPMYEHSGKSDKCYVKGYGSTFFGMDGFDMLAMGYHCLIHPMHWLNLTGSCIPMHFITDSRLL